MKPPPGPAAPPLFVAAFRGKAGFLLRDGRPLDHTADHPEPAANLRLPGGATARATPPLSRRDNRIKPNVSTLGCVSKG